jgi:RecB family exonuclease
LLICRPYLADDGQPWEASPYWAAVQGLLKDAPTKRVRPTNQVRDVASDQELVDVVSGEEVYDMMTVLCTRARSDTSPWNGYLGGVRERLAERFGPDQPWSSSRLESYAKCPLLFWAVYVMELVPRDLPEIGFDVLTLGSIYHLILERLYRHVSDGDPDRLRAELPAVAQQVYDAAPNEYGFRPTPLWKRQQSELSKVLSRTLDALIEHAGRYTPLVQELAFGVGDRAPLVLDGESPLRLRGYIDRVDRGPDGRLRIIDYKAGSTPISSRDLSDGRRLQLPLYAMAAQQVLQAQVCGGCYWHIGAARPSTLRLEEYVSPDGAKRGVGGAIETAVSHAVTIAANVRSGLFMPAPPDDGCPRFCPAAAFCERYRPQRW